MADAGRVIAGSAKGVRLRAPGPGTRPLADRVKQTLFAIVEPDLPGAHVLDLFAGSGAAGIEALSRGAASAVFVERDAGAAAVIDANLRAAGLAGAEASVVRWDVIRWIEEAHDAVRFDVVLVDPPYAETELLTRVLRRLGAPDAPLAPRARVVAKHFWRDRPPEQIGMLAVERERRFGETALTFYRRMEAETGPMTVATGLSGEPS
ncbi:MAG TPA: 16S rRNA (guanine(966)-N(2))-methyltransferase RsmD [Candidatus Limnocylindrales bacterium]|nr:16S rRNA (guanine(966)-N(2))-methyltransferase RsmD [Candidatus Limnocylindrales bacterium]